MLRGPPRGRERIQGRGSRDRPQPSHPLLLVPIRGIIRQSSWVLVEFRVGPNELLEPLVELVFVHPGRFERRQRVVVLNVVPLAGRVLGRVDDGLQVRGVDPVRLEPVNGGSKPTGLARSFGEVPRDKLFLELVGVTEFTERCGDILAILDPHLARERFLAMAPVSPSGLLTVYCPSPRFHDPVRILPEHLDQRTKHLLHVLPSPIPTALQKAAFALW